MQWNGAQSNPDRPAPLRSLMELLQKKAEPYVTEYGENQLPGAGQLLNSILRTGTEMVPGVGDLLGAEDLQAAAQNNDWGGIGVGMLAAIPGIPSFSRGAGGDIRATARAVREAAEAAPAPRVEPMTESDAALARYRAVNPNDTGARVLNPGDEGYPTNAQWDEASQTYVAPRSVEDLMARAEAMGAKLDISQGNNGLTLSRIVVPPSARSQGVGSRIMRDVENYADSAGLPVGLTPSGDFGGSVPRLNEFYRRFGFMPNRGRSRDFSTRETMLRQPREVAPVAPVEPNYPIRAFHGSPHSFDRFSLDKIGTGEGAQAYGHGLYFAENENVARQYRDNVKNMAPIVEINQRLSDLSREMSSLETGYRQYREPRGYELAAEYDDLMNRRSEISNAPGSMYEVGINADPNTFLDWDRPLSEQPEVLQTVSTMFGPNAGGLTGQELYKKAAGFDPMVNVARNSGGDAAFLQTIFPEATEAQITQAIATAQNAAFRNDRVAAQMLQEAGIPGVRYLDEGSRGIGEGTRNYVLFNDDLVKILRKYGISGLSTTVGASALAEELDRRERVSQF